MGETLQTIFCLWIHWITWANVILCMLKYSYGIFFDELNKKSLLLRNTKKGLHNMLNQNVIMKPISKEGRKRNQLKSPASNIYHIIVELQTTQIETEDRNIRTFYENHFKSNPNMHTSYRKQFQFLFNFTSKWSWVAVVRRLLRHTRISLRRVLPIQSLQETVPSSEKTATSLQKMEELQQRTSSKRLDSEKVKCFLLNEWTQFVIQLATIITRSIAVLHSVQLRLFSEKTSTDFGYLWTHISDWWRNTYSL